MRQRHGPTTEGTPRIGFTPPLQLDLGFGVYTVAHAHLLEWSSLPIRYHLSIVAKATSNDCRASSAVGSGP